MAYFFDLGFTTVFLIGDFVSSALAFVLGYFMLRSFTVRGRAFLFGFPIGCCFLGLSYLLFGVSYTFPSLEELSSWLSLFVESFGFLLIAGTYYLRKKDPAERVSRWLFYIAIALALAIYLLLTSGLPSLPSYRVVDEMFRVFNLFLLSYIIVFSLTQAFKADLREVDRMVLNGFILLALDQYSRLRRGLDSGFWSFAFAQLFRLAGLVVLVTTGITTFRSRG